MKSLIINGREISYEDIKKGSYSADDAYEQSTLSFCNEWLTGTNNFELFTSGSTSAPKPISVNRDQMASSARMTGKALNLQENDKALVCLNTNFIAGKMMLVRGLELGLQLTIIPPDSSPFHTFADKTQFNFVALVPLQMETTLEKENYDFHFKKMKGIIIGGAPVSARLENGIQNVNTPVYVTYGMTETVSHVALRRINGENKSGFYTLLDGINGGVDHRNCLWLEGAVTKNERIQTNDLVEFHNNRQFLWKGRIDNVINSGGIKIFPEEIERELEVLFASQKLNNRFFISSLPDEKLGEKVVLFIEGKENQFSTEILRSLKNKISQYKIPKQIIYIDQFKETATGKVDRKKTKEDY